MLNAAIALSGKAEIILLTPGFLLDFYVGLAIWSLHSKYGEDRFPVLMRLHAGRERNRKAKIKIANYSSSKRRLYAFGGAILASASILLEVWFLVSAAPHLWNWR